MDLSITNSYYEKYLKYKAKYINLQKEINLMYNLSNMSNLSNKEQENKTGGGYFYEQNDLIKRTNMLVSRKFSKDLYQFSSIYLKANLTNQQIRKKYSKIRKTILKNSSHPPHNYHLTLLIFEINLD